MNSYELSRIWFDFCFENPEKIKPNHTALYFFAIEHCNRLGWKQKFGLPSSMTMEAIGIKSYNTYISALKDLVEWGFIKMIEKSKNQYSSNIIALSKFNKALDKALDKAFIKHATKQSESTHQSIDSIDKQLTIEQLTKKQINKSLLSEIKISDVESFLPDEVEYFKIAEAFRQLFIKNQNEKQSPTTHQEKATYKNYVNPIRLAFEIDSVTKEQFTTVFKFLDSKNGEWWKSNILSTDKLRKQMSQLVMKAKETPRQNNNQGFVADAEYFQRVANSDAAKNFKFK